MKIMRGGPRVVSWLFTTLGAFGSAMYAQVEVAGLILDMEEVPIPYATVYLALDHVGSTAQTDGSFHLLANAVHTGQDTLVVRCLGYRTRRIPVALLGQQYYRIVLEQETYELAPFDVFATAELPKAKDLLKWAHKAVRRQYLGSSVQLTGYYREMLAVDGVYQEFNDALLVLDLGSYPSPSLSRRSFDEYWDEFFGVSKYSSKGPLSGFAQYWPIFIDPEDRVSIITSRASEPRGPGDGGFASYGDPLGGPVDLISMDNVKYELQFLDPKLRKHYVFKTTGKTVDHTGRACYVVEFFPKAMDVCYFHHFARKVGVALYKGRMTITTRDHILSGFDCKSVDWKTHTAMCSKPQGAEVKDHRPLSVGYSVRYRPSSQGWVLNKIDYLAQYAYQRRDMTEENVSWERSLFVGTENAPMVHPEPASAFPIRHETLRSRYSAYDPSAWVSGIGNFPYVPPPARLQNDLGRTVALEQQFSRMSGPVSELAAPDTASNPCMVARQDIGVGTDCLTAYQRIENEYADLVLQRLVDNERRFSYDAYHVLERDRPTMEPDTSVGVFIGKDDRNVLWLCERNGAGEVDSLLNLTTEIARRPASRLTHYSVEAGFVICTFSSSLDQAQDVFIWKKSTGSPVDSVKGTSFHCLVEHARLFYTVRNAQGRVDRAFLHTISGFHEDDVVVFACADVRADIECVETTSGEFISIRVVSKDGQEQYVFRKTDDKVVPVLGEEAFFSVALDHFEDEGLIVAVRPKEGPSEVRTVSLGPKSESVPLYTTLMDIVDFYIVDSILVLSEYHGFNMRLVLITLSGDRSPKIIEMGSGPQGITLEKGVRDAPNGLEVTYESPGSPSETFHIDAKRSLLRSARKDKWSKPNKGGAIVTEVLIAPVADGEHVPILVSYDRRVLKDSVTAMLVRVYGAYGALEIPSFRETDVVLMQRGFVLAQVGVRGSGVLGRGWYEAGRLLNKQNSFRDFSSAVKYLKQQFNVPTQKVFGKGVSAGGLIIAGCMNGDPGLLGGAILDRPFLDVYGSMMDPYRYLTTLEYEEWGDPQKKEVGDFILSYSPIQNIRRQSYPPIFLRGSALDRITPSADILKAAYNYRASATNEPFLLCKIRPNEGHEIQYRLKEQAEEFAFMMCVVSNAWKSH